MVDDKHPQDDTANGVKDFEQRAEKRQSMAALMIVAAALVLGGGSYLVFSSGDQEENPTEASAPTPSSSVASTTDQASEQQTTGAQSTQAASTQAGANDIRVEANPEGTSEAGAPSFDVVRVDPSGDLVVAGRAEAGSTVTVLDNGTDFDSTIATPEGEFVSVPDAPLAPGSHTLSLRSLSSDGARTLTSPNTVVVVVPDQPGGAPLAVMIDESGAGPSQILQGPDVPAGLELTLTQIDYDTEGRAVYQGTGRSTATVRLYLDNEVLGDTIVSGERRWIFFSDDPVAAGVHELRIDQLNEAGEVEARIVVSFERESAAAASASGLGGQATEQVELVSGFVTVREGQSLWRIARAVYGEGTQYTVIYQSNQDQIRDPDLIYPGQVFTLPER